MGYLWVWIVILATVLVALFALYRATRNLPLPRARRVLAWLLVVWLLLPAPVPGYPGNYAPAFLVFAFESLFQRQGKPQGAGIILAAGTALAVALMLLVAARRRRGRRNKDNSPDATLPPAGSATLQDE